MVNITNPRTRLLTTLTDLGIHASQIKDGFDIEENGNYNTVPGVYTIADKIPALTSAFRLYRAKYTTSGELLYTAGGHFCGSELAEQLIQHLNTTDIDEVITYIQDFHTRAAMMLESLSIIPTNQAIGTLMGLAAYRCPGINPGNIAALPHCSGDLAYENVYIPFLRAGASLSEIVTACAKRIGNPFEITYLMHTIPVRYGTVNLYDHEHTLENIRLGIYGN